MNHIGNKVFLVFSLINCNFILCKIKKFQEKTHRHVVLLTKPEEKGTFYNGGSSIKLATIGLINNSDILFKRVKILNFVELQFSTNFFN